MAAAGVFFSTLRDQRRGLVAWSIGVALTVVVMAAIWPSFADMDIGKLLAEYPQAMKDLFDVGGMSTGTGYLNAELFSLMLPAIFIIYGVSRGARLIAGEEEDGTLEVLATMPISRTGILCQKCAALMLDVAVLAVVLFLATWLSSAMFGLDIAVLDSARGAIAMGFIGVEFGLVALALSAATGRRTLAVGVSAGLAGASYLIYLVAQLIESLRPLRVVSPFYQAISRGPIGPVLPPIAWVMVAVGLICFAWSIVVFRSRDLGG